jgi:arylsulfatase A-like enzyme
MKRLEKLTTIVTILLLSVSISFAEQRPPNIVLILADDQGWTGFSEQMAADVVESRSDFYQTPNLARLAKEGMRFSQGYAPAPVCSPTRDSIQSGMSPAKIGVTHNNASHKQFCDPAFALANLIKQADSRYVTAHFG